MARGSVGKSLTMTRGARSRANLKRGGSPGRTKLTPEQKAQEKEARKLARKLLDPAYMRELKARLLAGKAQPGVEVAVWQYAFGKPTETVDLKQPIPVRISHEYSK